MRKIILIIMSMMMIMSCCEIPEKNKQPEYSYAKVIVDSSPNNEWEVGFIISQGDANSLILQGNSEMNTHTKFIYKNSPFAVVFNFKKFNQQAVISTYIDNVKKESVDIRERPILPIVILYSNNNTLATKALLEEIQFDATIIIINN